MADQQQQILHNFSPFMTVYKNGQFKRLMGLETVPTTLDSQTGILSKDVVVSPESNLSARLYLPSSATPGANLPLLLYFHGGGFIVESPFSPMYHRHINHLVAAAGVVTLSVDYRLAPEHPLPAAYDDAWTALQYTASPDTDEWIRLHADPNRLYLGGDSAGGNIVHSLLARLGGADAGPRRFSVVGAFLNCPYFDGSDVMGDEETHPVFPKKFLDELWRYICPTTEGLDDPRLNPAANGEVLRRLGCRKVLVVTAGKDVLRWRGRHYKEVLEGSGWEGNVEIVEYEEEDHVFSVIDPTTQNAKAVFIGLDHFINL